MDDLLDFAKSLDYNSYVEDVEVREALRFVKDRVGRIESLQKQEQLEQQKLARRQQQLAVAAAAAGGGAGAAAAGPFLRVFCVPLSL